MEFVRPHLRTTTTAAQPALPPTTMKLTKSIFTSTAPLSFLGRRRLRAGCGRSRGSGAENPEPTSPKVTCIGQVRVKSKRRAVKRCGSLLRRRIATGEVSFRKIEHSDPQRWVHLPISVCAAFRALGAEFSCLFRRGGCFSRVKSGCCANENACGRWMVAAKAGGGGKKRVVVVSGGDEEMVMSIRSSRRHVFDDLAIKDDRIEEEASTVSICIPPKNALLLMRCRSDPIKMAALATRAASECGTTDEDIGEDNHCEETSDFEGLQEVRGLGDGKEETPLVKESGVDVSVETRQNEAEEGVVIGSEEKKQEIDAFEAVLDQENTEQYEDCAIQVAKEDEEIPISCHLPSSAIEKQKEHETEESANSDEKNQLALAHQEDVAENQELVMRNQETNKEKERSELPECLLLMMWEPKLSMEVSKETWVRSTDFVWRQPEPPCRPAKAACYGNAGKRRPCVDSKPKRNVPAPPTKETDQQPARWSCSLPAASMATVVEQKVVSAGAFGLTRCKSEPMRAAAANLMPEPHRMAKLGVGGAAGVGF